MNPPDPLTLPDWRRAYRGGASPTQLLLPLLQRLRSDSPPEAWITLTSPEALASVIAALEQRAASFTDRTAALNALPLFGVPFAVKDNIDVAGLLTTAACPAFAHRALADARTVARLIAAGAVCIGKTNLDQFATGLVGARSPYGRPSSTFSAEHISGGSSSGSAVVVSRGDVPFALGTDTAGSGRVPAGFNNIVGLKPTPGRVSTAGVLPACRTLDCVSILALTVADAAEVLAVIEGVDGADAYSDFRLGAALPKTVLRIGVPALPVFGDAAYTPCFEQALAQARSLGHTVVPIDFAPLFSVASLLYSGPWVAERHAVLQTLLDADPGAFDPTVRRVIESATQFSATDTFRAQYTLRDAQRSTQALWHDLDLLMVPTAPTHPTHRDIDADPLGANSLLGTYTNFVNLLGWCALALPAGFTAGGLPFGVTFIAPGAADAALARFGQQWEASVQLPRGATGQPFVPADRNVGPSAAWPASQATLPIAVVGAHLSGLPLNPQLQTRGATLREVTQTAPHYRLYALPGTTPPKPGLQRVPAGADGASIAVEVWDMPLAEVGSFLALIAPPLGLGNLELIDGRCVHGFVCEAHALAAARDITAFGGWRAFLAAGAAA
jgi:allophanate hydrolase